MGKNKSLSQIELKSDNKFLQKFSGHGELIKLILIDFDNAQKSAALDQRAPPYPNKKD